MGLAEAAHRGVVQARDNLQKLVCREMADACSLNFLGLLWEQEGLLTEAQGAFTRLVTALASPSSMHYCLFRALRCCQNESSANLLAVNFNLARVQRYSPGR
jgi:hypothetical protein